MTANVSIPAIPRISVCSVPKTLALAGLEVVESAKPVLQVSDVPERFVFER